MPTTAVPHIWKFFRAGGLDQVQLDSAEDFLDLERLDQKLWVALSCPVKGLEFDEKTLAFIDTDRDGRIRVPELAAAVKWTAVHLRDPVILKNGAAALPLAAINDTIDSGRILLASAREILRSLGKADADAITAADTADTAKIFSQTRFNGDGIVPAESAGDDATKQLLADIIACLGAETDRSGLPGVSQARADQFFAELAAYDAWWKTGETSSSAGASVLPLGENTPAAFEAYRAVKAKIEDYFARCRLAAFDPRAAAPLNRTEAEYAALAARDLSRLGDDIAALPLQKIEPNRPLDLAAGINPAWLASVAAFRAAVLTPIHGASKTSLTDAEWIALAGKFSAYEAWLASKKGGAVEKLGLGRIRQLLAGGGRAALADLLARDLAAAPVMAGIDGVDRLVRFHRDLYRLLANFVNFSDFYDPRREAIFQVGTLYLDGRSCNLCLHVDDPAAHAGLAVLSKFYIAYCDCTRPGGETLKIAACVTQGDSDYLMVGRNGIFYDRKGRDWDATVIRIIDNPISIRQAFWSPYKKFIRFLEELVARRAATADAAAGTKLSGAADAAAAAAPPKKFDLALITVALGSIGTFLATVFSKFVEVPAWQLPFILLSLVLVVSLPSMIIAALKLRQRTLGPVLDANGWAINGRIKVNLPLGTSLTRCAELPPGSASSLDDPFEDKAARRRTRLILALLVVLVLVAAYWWLIRPRP